MVHAGAGPGGAVRYRNYAEGPLLPGAPGHISFWLIEVDDQCRVTSRSGRLVPGMGATPTARLQFVLAQPTAGTRGLIGRAHHPHEARALAIRHVQAVLLAGGVLLWPSATGQPNPPANPAPEQAPPGGFG